MKAISFLALIPIFFMTLNTLTAQEEEFGLASFYSDDFHGRKTAYGDYYDKDKLTAAHKKYPYGTKIKVTRLDNNKSVVVTVTDKGPYIKGRVVDLSRRAAESIGLVADGVAQVKVELAGRSVKPAEEVVAASKPTSFDKPEPTITTTSKPKETVVVKTETPATKPAETAKTVVAAEKPAAAKETTTTATPADIKFKLVQQDYNQYGLYKIVLQKPEQKGFGVQVASLSNYENVLKQVADLQAKWFDNILISAEKGGANPIYKVILGPFTDEKTAETYQSSLTKKYKIKGFVVNLEEIKY